MSDLHTDGNHAAGLIEEFLAAEATTTMRRCQTCHDEHPLAAHRAYRGAGMVLRCPGCGDVGVIISERGEELVLQWRGTYRIRRPA
jgi:flavoprotein